MQKFKAIQKCIWIVLLLQTISLLVVSQGVIPTYNNFMSYKMPLVLIASLGHVTLLHLLTNTFVIVILCFLFSEGSWKNTLKLIILGSLISNFLTLIIFGYVGKYNTALFGLSGGIFATFPFIIFNSLQKRRFLDAFSLTLFIALSFILKDNPYGKNIEVCYLGHTLGLFIGALFLIFKKYKEFAND